MDDFTTFGTSHLLMLAVLVLGLVPAAALGRRARRRGEAATRRLTRGVAVVLVVVMVPAQVVDFLPGQYDAATTWPLQLCDLAWMAAAAGLWTRHRYPVALTYFWGLPLATQAMITPALASAFPAPKFLTFWFMHLMIVWCAVLLTWGLGITVGWRDYATTVATTAVWLVVVYSIDVATGTNYGFLVRKPAGSVLDYLGPWPTYVGAMVVVVALVWALMTYPWVRAARTFSRSTSGESAVPPTDAIQS